MDSSLVDAGITATWLLVPNVINGVNITEPRLSILQQLQYKAIIMLEGNDVASGLKWALLSNSAVLMPEPTFTSWALEELLEPWVHYVPLQADMLDVEEKVQWVTDNDEKAELIAKRGSLWIEDMVYHDAKREEKHILEELLRRYAKHFRPAHNLAEASGL